MPTARSTTKPKLKLGKVTTKAGKLKVERRRGVRLQGQGADQDLGQRHGRIR